MGKAEENPAQGRSGWNANNGGMRYEYVRTAVTLVVPVVTMSTFGGDAQV